MTYQISDLIDLKQLQRLMVSLHQATGIKHALIDNDSRVLTAVGWESVCTDFHRVNPKTCARCLESDRYILDHLQDGPYVGYDCPNGLVDYATPVIIDGEHLANIFTGQIFHEPPEMEFFRRQAAEFGFDETTYLAAVRQVPIIPRERMPSLMSFLVGLAQMLGQHGLTRLRQLEADTELRALNEDLTHLVLERTKEVLEKTDKLRGLYELSPLGIALTDMDGRFIEFNEAFRQISGYSADDLKRLDYWALTPKKYQADVARQLDSLTQTGRYGPYEKEYRRADGSLIPLRLNGMAVSGSDGRQYVWSMVEDITRLKEHENELLRIAHFDVLTGVPNRVLLADQMNQAIAQTWRKGDMMAVCFLDLDGFKPFNDHFSHDAGDQLLVDIARRLKECVRGGDTVARIGGDEFVLLLLGLGHLDECDAALKRILAAITRPMTVGGTVTTISASLGATLFPSDDSDGDTLIRHADQAMYLAKQAGKNRYHLFDPEQARRNRLQHEQISLVDAALHNHEFVLYYQPKVDMRRGIPFGAEALIRWQHPLRGVLSPGSFLPVVENTDLIVAIGDWVIATALEQLAAWRRDGLNLTVSVNIAARHLLRQDFVQRLQEHLAAHPDVLPGSLELEVLETAALEDIQHVAAIIRNCREMGVRFAMDDFGTGYSSLAYLKQLPVEALKIDKSFVRGMLANREDVAIVEGVIGLSEVFGLSVVAEGVETADHGVQLLDMGCDLAQGYFIARPMPAEMIPEWVRVWRPQLKWIAKEAAKTRKRHTQPQL